MGQVWYEEYPHLKFRCESSHSVRSTCVRHRALIKGLGSHLNARTAQILKYTEHLRMQYRDRQIYWSDRGQSRPRGSVISVIIDSMDQAKFALPRGSAMKSKDLSGLNRPKCHITAALVHGHCLLITVSDQDIQKSSSTMIDILAHTLTMLQLRGVPLSACTREMKNNPFCRFLGSMVAHSKLASASLTNLVSRHSHEDIDQVFGQLAQWLIKTCRTAECPTDFTQAIDAWLAQLPRPHEKGRHCVRLSCVRDWIFAFNQSD